MVQYRRSQTPGGTYFFTVNLRDRTSQYLTTYIDDLRKAFHDVRQRRAFKIVAVCILPEHIHMVMELPSGDSGYPGRWKAIKSQFTRSLVKKGLLLTKNIKGEYNLWQRRYWEHEIRNELDLQKHVDYIHFNPVKHGHVSNVIDWPHSSFHRYVRDGLLEERWGGQVTVDGDGYGE
ncbi:MAG: transposase [Candidatus Scalindua sp.]|nr:transposase [Candidatus Scalindua sp.]